MLSGVGVARDGLIPMVLDIQKRTGAEAFNGVFIYGGMPYEIAENSVGCSPPR